VTQVLARAASSLPPCLCCGALTTSDQHLSIDTAATDCGYYDSRARSIATFGLAGGHCLDWHACVNQFCSTLQLIDRYWCRSWLRSFFGDNGAASSSFRLRGGSRSFSSHTRCKSRILYFHCTIDCCHHRRSRLDHLLRLRSHHPPLNNFQHR